MNLITFFLRGSKWGFAFAVLCGMLSGAGSAGLISLINAVLAGHPPAGAAWRFVGFGVLALGTRVASQTILNNLQQGVLQEMREDLVRRILAAPLRRLEESGGHRLLAVLTEDVLVISNSLLSIPHIFINAAIIVGCLSYLAWLSPRIFLALLAFGVVGFLSYRLPVARAMGSLRAARDTQDTLYKHLSSVIHGVKELKLHPGRRGAFLKDSLGETTSAMRRLNTYCFNIFAATSSWGMFLFFGFIGLLLFVLPVDGADSGGTLVGYTLTVLYLQQPLDGLMSNVPYLGRGGVSLRKIEKLSKLSEDPKTDLVHLLPASTSFNRLELVDVTHSYHREREDSRFTLGPISLTLNKGELVFLVGGNGSGKTTLAKLLTGLYSPESGEVRLDGVPITEQEQERYRQCFSTVFSDFYLFESLLGLAPTDLVPRARQYLERLHLNHKVKIHDDGTLSTTDLSQGQRKRLALLTAWLEDRPIFVFDEWGADQDPIFKEVFYTELLPELKQAGKTVLAISHDDRYFHVADRVLHLESGKLLPEENAAPSSVQQRAS
ncbi:cyclic peptide export ABC transporter [Archangium primigenium]|uniref:cyclic peptide export ABC transporter n=1 Tax=[Archangium] primigenium TaxID=2792470 RepID=UPI001959AC06|nr:cyclic peptide export ABC transporter [Archangium primigenium]MBM7114698.1 cyclic peptide export ABC transporter [Archangium primigenium]